MVSLLVVMSESEDAAFAKAILGRNNDWFVDSASSMASALDLLKRKRYDAIVISYNLRDGCCLSLREWINDECAFIVVTPPDDSRATAQALVGGATDCVIRDALFEISLRSSVANVVKQTGDKTTKVRLRRNTSPLPVNNRLKKVLARKREEGQPVGH